MTHEQAKAALEKATDNLSKAKRESAAARDALAAARQALADAAFVAGGEEPRTKAAESEDEAQARARAREAARYAAEERLTESEFTQRQAAEALDEAQARVARLAPHAAALAALDKALAGVAAKDAAITALGLDLHARVAAEVRELRALIEDATRLCTALPVEVRTLDLNPPRAAALTWGSVEPDGADLMSMLSGALWRQLGGRFPSSNDKPRALRG